MRPYTVHGISENEATNEIIIKKKMLQIPRALFT